MVFEIPVNSLAEVYLPRYEGGGWVMRSTWTAVSELTVRRKRRSRVRVMAVEIFVLDCL